MNGEKTWLRAAMLAILLCGAGLEARAWSPRSGDNPEVRLRRRSHELNKRLKDLEMRLLIARRKAYRTEAVEAARQTIEAAQRTYRERLKNDDREDPAVVAAREQYEKAQKDHAALVDKILAADPATADAVKEVETLQAEKKRIDLILARAAEKRRTQP
jgi:cytochrome c556